MNCQVNLHLFKLIYLQILLDKTTLHDFCVEVKVKLCLVKNRGNLRRV